MKKKISMLILFLIIGLSGFNQVIKGTIQDQKSHEKIPFAYIYFNGTFTGTTSDEQGNFELNISKNPSMPITVSAIGYYSMVMNILSPAQPVIVNLKPKIYELEDVVIQTKSLVKKRKEYLSLFREAFLGSTSNAMDCEIENESDLTFNYATAKDTLRAYASKALIINNKALGYKISYFLDEFEFYKKSEFSFYFSGSIIFTNDLTTDRTKKAAYEANRKESYLGSRMHFFRSLWENNLYYAGFKIKDSNNMEINYSQFVFKEGDLTKYLKYPKKLGICYDTNLPESFISFPEGEVYFEENGYFDPLAIVWEGEMGKQRIADWLPYEYSYK